MKKTVFPKEFWKLTHIFMDTFLFNNIVLVQAIGLCPIIAAGVNLKYGVALVVLIIILLVRPQGILGRKERVG